MDLLQGREHVPSLHGGLWKPKLLLRVQQAQRDAAATPPGELLSRVGAQAESQVETELFAKG